MAFAVLRENEKLADFVARTYGTSTSEERKRIEAALLRSNPGLDVSGSVKRGSVVVVLPDIPRAEAAEDERLGPDAVVRNLLDIARASTPLVGGLLSARVERQRARVQETSSVLEEPQLRRLSARDPDLKRRLDLVTGELAKREEDLRAIEKAHAEAVTQLAADLDALLAQPPRSEPPPNEPPPKEPSRTQRPRSEQPRAEPDVKRPRRKGKS